MEYELRSYAREHYGEIADRWEREGTAEQRLVRLHFEDAAEGTYIEVGANDPKRFSQTWHLERAGWSGVLVEPIGALCDRLRAERPRSVVVQAACAGPDDRGEAEFFVTSNSAHSGLDRERLDARSAVERTETVRVMTLDEVIAETDLAHIDFLSIDVEGAQLDVLRGFDIARHRPGLVLIEDHLTDLRTHRHFRDQRYKLAKRTGVNSWYVPEDMEFRLTSPRERLRLWSKVARTPFRRIEHAIKRRRHRT